MRKRGAEPSANSIDAARNAGVAIGTQLASNDRPHVNPFAKLLGLATKDEDDEDDTAAPSAAVASAPASHPVLAPLSTARSAALKWAFRSAPKWARKSPLPAKLPQPPP